MRTCISYLKFSDGLVNEPHLLLFMIRYSTFPCFDKARAGVHLPVMGFDKSGNGGMENPHSREQILSIARKAESLGYDLLSVNNHIVFRTSWLDSLSALSAVAAITNRIKLGTSVLNIVVRNPVICARLLSVIDILSSGRLFAAGVGPSSHKGDYDVCGIPFEQ